ncbi:MULTISPECIES: glycine cleavage system aminomethyltransferase GcvT [Thermomonospora]|uniref:Aminomethyltransferase n=1 Tax=Thermomonospora curvata (strain ATCC 19995 / DSM 43183 / JCM 3096 / KCTC 9072 / NBRC 15933 / NCIMB 10081 / Henssen B9) TaxID=471852 RepID=D1AD66_THECD|nr:MULTISPECIES: glycine cleavage system aminomethyltransferase GcvT [Thermomonospora]ACY99375.1 glycine cleavage system T protein [Thermomonospora curvata DSM 43183]PKK12424.1 MAG: glycine cleavage system protein T [Thermomonospora sp. CIF 1]
MSADNTTAKKTPLYDVHRELGATIVDFAGFLMPLRYGGETAEHRAVRTAAGLFDLSHMGEIFVQGPQAAQALDYALVGRLSTVKVGRARYTMLCAPDGGVLDDLIVYRLADDRFLVVANAANVATVHRALTERAASFQAEVADRSDDYALIALQGPHSQRILSRFTDVPLAEVKYYAWAEGAVAGVPALIARTGYTGEDGFELFVAAGDAVRLWRELAGAEGVLPAGLAARDTLRLEAGMPLYGNELTAETTPYEAGLGRVVKLDKPGDFVGKKALAAYADTPAGRRLVGLVARGRRAPRKGYQVVRADDGAVCGVVTSGAPSPTLGRPIAMAYVDRGAVGAELAVDVRGRRERVDVVDLPFYKRSETS